MMLVDRHAMALGLDVPERDVDRRNGAADQRAHEVRVPLQRLRVMLDRRGVAPHEIGLPAAGPRHHRDVLAGGPQARELASELAPRLNSRPTTRRRRLGPWFDHLRVPPPL